MFPLTHVYLAAHLFQDCSQRTILGSIFPDLGNYIGLNRDITHEMGAGFYGFCWNNYPRFLDFAQGIISHGSYPRGLDYYADENYGEGDRGYCFQKGSLIVDPVVKACAIPAQMGLWKAHNFIEMAYELISAERMPELTEMLRESLENREVIAACSHLLGQYFNLDTSPIGEIFKKMPDFFCINNLSAAGLGEKYALQLKLRHQITEADPGAIAKLIEEAKALVEADFSNLMGFCLIEVGEICRAMDQR